MKDYFGRKQIFAMLVAIGIVAVTGSAMAVGDDGTGGVVPDRGIVESDEVRAISTDSNGKHWGVMEYASRDDGDRCLTVGEERSGQIGTVNRAGKFEPTRLSEGTGSCGDFDSGAVVVRGIVDAKGVTQETIFYGTLGPDQKAITVTPENGKPVEGSLGSGKTFVVALPGMVAPDKATVTFTKNDGSMTTR